MKNLFYTLLLLPFIVFAQIPQAINYQATAYDGSGEELHGQDIDVKLSIIKGAASGASQWVELHSVTTSEAGLFNLHIGRGEKLGGAIETFTAIDWLTHAHFLKIELDVEKNGSYVGFGTQQFMTLPYALYVEESSDSSVQGPQGVQGAQGVKGPQGEQGIQGFQGEQGMQGSQGEQGIQGSQGEQGIKGEKGDQGPRGEQGVKGPQGEQGVNGETGEQGPRGEQGLKGERGLQGERGIQGKPGEIGPQGERGFQGERGTRGEQGVQGKPGEMGPQGERGLQGERGARGEQGVQGKSGEIGPQGDQGLQGERGPRGEQGVQGESGEIGPQGDQGPQGERGPRGEQGVQGRIGETGSQGERGLQGERGPRGAQGVQGKIGETGSQGERGLRGEQGIQGNSGERGPEGQIGPQGLPGLQGEPGPQGEPGKIPTHVDSLLNVLQTQIKNMDDLFKSFESKFGCLDAKACTYDPYATMANNSCEYPERGYDCDGNITEPYVGMEVFGGVVFKLDETGKHGLVTTLKDIDYTDWVSAKSICESYVDGDYEDWSLPGVLELTEMYKAIGYGSDHGNVGGFASANYWSSETSKTGNCNQSFGFSINTGYINCETENPNLYVRPIRSF